MAVPFISDDDVFVVKLVEFNKEAFPRVNLLMKRLKSHSSQLYIPPPAVLFYCCTDNNINYDEFTVKEQTRINDTRDYYDVRKTNHTIVCILEASDGDLTSNDIQILNKYYTSKMSEEQRERTIFVVDLNTPDNEMIRAISSKIQKWFERFSETNNILHRLFSRKSKEIPIRLSLLLEKQILTMITAKLGNGATEQTIKFLRILESVLKKPEFSAKCSLSLDRDPLGKSELKSLCLNSWQLDTNELTRINSDSTATKEATVFGSSIFEEIGHIAFKALTEELKLLLNDKDTLSFEQLADEFNFEPRFVRNVVRNLTETISLENKNISKTESESLWEFRMRVSERISEMFIINKPEIKRQIIEIFKSVFLEKINDVTILYAVEAASQKNQIDCRGHALKLVTERCQWIEAFAMVNNKVTVYVKNKNFLTIVLDFISNYIENTDDIRVCEYQSMKVKELIFGSGSKVSQQYDESRYGTVGFVLRDKDYCYYCATCKHVISSASLLQIQTDDQDYVKARHFFSPKGSLDFSLIKLLNNDINCNCGIKNKQEEFVTCELFEVDMITLPNETEVYKWGATTQLSKGIYKGVLCQKNDSQNYQTDTYQISDADGDNGPFAKGGDSGSLICFVPSDSMLFTNDVAAFMLTGKVESWDGIENPDVYACYSVAEALAELRKASIDVIPCFSEND